MSGIAGILLAAVGVPSLCQGIPDDDAACIAYRQREFERARVLWQARAEEGDAHAQFAIARMHQVGLATQRNLKKARSWYSKASKRGHPRAQFRLGVIEWAGGSPHKAHPLLFKAATADLPKAQFALGSLYASGELAEKIDYDKALRWWHRAAENGLPEAQLHLGQIYHDGIGVVPDYDEAVRWLRTAAERGNPNAQMRLGMLYSAGKGVSRDCVEGYAWLHQAFDVGELSARLAMYSCEEHMSALQLREAVQLAKRRGARIRAKAQNAQ